jgi:hypothetical protein
VGGAGDADAPADAEASVFGDSGGWVAD